MKTIEERAKEYNNKCTYACGMECNIGELAYIKGATDQQEIDTQKALKWILEHLADSTGWDFYDIEQAFLEAMKEK